MGSLRESAFELARERFFEAAVVPELWPNALDALARACGSTGAVGHLVVGGHEPPRAVASESLAEFMTRFVDEGWHEPDRNTRMQRGLALVSRGWRGIITEHDAFTREELARDPYQQECALPAGFSSYAGAVVAAEPGMQFVLVLERQIREGPFSRSDVAAMNRLFSQLSAACSLALRVGVRATRQLVESLAQVGDAIALLDWCGRVFHANTKFESLVGDSFCLSAGRLSAFSAQATRALKAAIDRAVRADRSSDTPFEPIVLPRPGEKRPLVARVIPVIGAAHDFLQPAHAIMIVTDLAQQVKPSPSLLAQAFELTPAEARLASHLTSGKALPAIATAEGKAYDTVRHQLRAIFDKTGTHRRAELVSLLNGLSR